MADRPRRRRALVEIDTFHDELPVDRVREGAAHAEIAERRACEVGNQHVLAPIRRSAGTRDDGNAGCVLQRMSGPGTLTV